MLDSPALEHDTSVWPLLRITVKLGINYSEDVHRPYVEEHFNFMGHFTKPQQVQEEIRELQQSTEKTVPAR